VAIPSLDAIESAQRQLKDHGAPPAVQQKAQFQRADYMDKARASREHALKEFTRTCTEFPADTDTAAEARLRVAKLVPRGDFRASLQLCEDVARNHPNAPQALRHRAQLEAGIVQFQLGDEAAAKATLEALRADSPDADTLAEVNKYLTGLSDPDSPESIVITYDRGIRQKDSGGGFDLTFEDMQRVKAKSKKAAIEALMRDASLSSEDRARMRYRVCYALYWGGRGREAFDLAQSILDEQKPEGKTKWECLHMQAFLVGRSGDFGGAIARWRAMIDANPDVGFLPQCYVLLAEHQLAAGDALGSVLTLEEMRARFPARIEAERAAESIGLTLRLNPGIQPTVDEQRPAIVAKWTRNKGGPPAGPGDRLPGAPRLAATESKSGKGGAE
jgi:hypothetical protein